MRTTIPMQNPAITQPLHTNPDPNKLDTMRTGAHTTYNINYHIVTIPKYRRQILTERPLKSILEEIVNGQCESRGWEVLAFEIQGDHIHLFLSVPPKTPVSYVTNIIKGNSSRQLRCIFPKLMVKYNMGDHFWAKGYFVSTAGYISENTVKRYIDEQRQHEQLQEWNRQHPHGRQGRLT